MSKLKPIFTVVFILFIMIIFHNNIVLFLGNINSLFKEDNKLELIKYAYEKKIEDLEKTIYEYELEHDNIKLYDSKSYILGKIALRDIYDFYSTLVINTDSKVKKGNAVINENGFVGIVEEADKSTAKVKLLTDLTLSVRIANSYGILDNYIEKDNLFVVHNIDNYKKIDIGDKVVTSGLTDVKEGIDVGEVVDIEKKGIEQVIYVKSEVDFDNLNYLYVMN